MKKNILIALSTLPVIAVAQDATTAVAASATNGLAFMAVALGVGLAAAVVGYAQSKAAAAALDGIARNPASAKEMFTPLLLSLALMEALVLLTFVIAFILSGKL